MNNQVIVPVAVIILIAIIIAIAFFNRRDKKEMEDQLKSDLPHKRLSDTDEGRIKRFKQFYSFYLVLYSYTTW